MMRFGPISGLWISDDVVNSFLDLAVEELTYEEMLVFRKAWNHLLNRMIEIFDKEWLIPEITREQWENAKKKPVEAPVVAKPPEETPAPIQEIEPKPEESELSQIADEAREAREKPPEPEEKPVEPAPASEEPAQPE